MSLPLQQVNKRRWLILILKAALFGDIVVKMLTNSSKKSIELLAPAKDASTGIAAINCGADAVYIGANKFSARENAGNSLSDIEKLVSYAHKFYARVYIAMNTILRDDELGEALSLADDLYAIGSDGLIIQDMGLLELKLPPIPLIASTQMNNDSLEKIAFLEKTGFSRVILPREMTLAEIKNISANTSIELESFIHGALCVSYSGQCYLSYASGGRSANRGKCAQPCRQLYALTGEDGRALVKDRHLLSLKDLNRSDHLDALVSAGITSFKIEGRLKDMPYVKNVVAFYRKKLDALLSGKHIARSSSGKTSFGFVPDPRKTFNRGYTDLGMTDKKEDLASIYTPKSLGEKIGPVENVKSGYFTLEGEHNLASGDGICFFDADKTLRGSVLNKIDGNKIFPDKMDHLSPGTVIYRNFDRLFIKALEKTVSERKIEAAFTFEETVDGFKLSVLDEDGNSGHYSVQAKKIAAEKKGLAGTIIERQVLKLNDTIFTAKKVTIISGAAYILPLSVLNSLRRGAVQNLMDERLKNRPRASGRVTVNDIPYPVKNIAYLGNCLNKKARTFYERHGSVVKEPAAESGLDMAGRMVMTSKYCVKKEAGLCGKNNAPLYLVDEAGRKYQLRFDCKKCRMEIFYPGKAT